MIKPDILEVVSRYTSLRQRGREYFGHAICHNDHSPSLRVNAEKQTWYCDPCAIGGDVITFVEVAEGTDFKGALKILGIDGCEYRPRPVDARKRRAAAMLATWMNEEHAKVGAVLRELTQCIVTAEEAGATTLMERWQREFSILEILFDDLARPECAGDLWAARGTIERITARAPVEPLPEFPEWTPEYASYLAAHLPAPEAAA